jgi:hypothetical protein
VNCVEHRRLAREHEDADQEFRVARDALMTSQGLAFRTEAQSIVKLAQKKRDASRAALKTHEFDHQCSAFTVSA